MKCTQCGGNYDNLDTCLYCGDSKIEKGTKTHPEPPTPPSPVSVKDCHWDKDAWIALGAVGLVVALLVSVSTWGFVAENRKNAFMETLGSEGGEIISKRYVPEGPDSGWPWFTLKLKDGRTREIVVGYSAYRELSVGDTYNPAPH